MLLNGKIGDFVIYEKTLNLTEVRPAIRIAYVGQKLGDAIIGKMMVNKSKIGGRWKYSIENSDWFDSVSELIDDVGDEYCQWLKNSFLGLNESLSTKTGAQR